MRSMGSPTHELRPCWPEFTTRLRGQLKRPVADLDRKESNRDGDDSRYQRPWPCLLSDYEGRIGQQAKGFHQYCESREEIWHRDLEGHVYELLQQTSDSVVVRGRCVAGHATVRTGQASFDVGIDPASGMVQSVDFWAEDGKTVVRRFTSEDVSTIDGVLIPGLLRMRDLSHNHETVIELEHAWYDRSIDSGIFETSARPQTRAYLSEIS